jgi:hypothetical protein
VQSGGNKGAPSRPVACRPPGLSSRAGRTASSRPGLRRRAPCRRLQLRQQLQISQGGRPAWGAGCPRTADGRGHAQLPYATSGPPFAPCEYDQV